jgi:hypothetical protein
MGDQLVVRLLPTRRTTQDTRKRTYIPRVGLEPTSPVSLLAKTVHISDHAANDIGAVYTATLVMRQKIDLTGV